MNSVTQRPRTSRSEVSPLTTTPGQPIPEPIAPPRYLGTAPVAAPLPPIGSRCEPNVAKAFRAATAPWGGLRNLTQHLAAQSGRDSGATQILIDLGEKYPALFRHSIVSPRLVVTGQNKPLGELVQEAIRGKHNVCDRFEAVANLYHNVLKIKYDEIPEGARPFPILARNRHENGGSFTAAQVLDQGFGLCQEKVAALRALLLMAGVYSDMVVVGAPDGEAATFGTHVIMQLYLDDGSPVLMDPDRAWCPGKKWRDDLSEGDFLKSAIERAKPHRDCEVILDDLFFGHQDSNTAWFKAVRSLNIPGLTPVERLADLAKAEDVANQALSTSTHFAEVKAVPMLVAIAHAKAVLDGLAEEGAARGTDRFYVVQSTIRRLRDVVRYASELARQPGWERYEQAWLHGLQAEANILMRDLELAPRHATNESGSAADDAVRRIGQRIKSLMESSTIPFTIEAQAVDAERLKTRLGLADLKLPAGA